MLCTGSLMTDWTVWSGCNNSCGAGYRFKTRLCNLDTCYDSTREVEPCIGDCLGEFSYNLVLQEIDHTPYIEEIMGITLSSVILSRKSLLKAT